MQDNTAFTCFLPEEASTLKLGAALARVLLPGMTLFLEGDLGAGKTTLTRGILRGLGFAGRVKSPTYTLVESYALSSLYFYHFDLYRFSDPLEWEDAGLREYFNAQSLCLIEWADKAEGLLPPPDWIIRLAPEGEGRRIRIEPRSEQGTSCLEKLNKQPPI
ncbi:tRNA threonylcarbamoyladenosine biosynthesis protein TsaE [Formivibrio citricus]|uniref:tRNA threonylcarbamoyladenosine biosynthesis protein TsaE n=1 Tax=Formivibrio citricus TaxID=83765 RepID=A0A1I4WK46_9NEIS|nr:tRNA (adenosine(37)-N6)-threonylcarbamoyltransferase complex ATPase subunit type 1 TsaE [Formivibrio citricus]SFN13580.1 tRNA threonylcarbamoyladenosine biosynthesis protein TsaE [Formivibrio citricus]